MGRGVKHNRNKRSLERSLLRCPRCGGRLLVNVNERLALCSQTTVAGAGRRGCTYGHISHVYLTDADLAAHNEKHSN